MNTRQDRVAWRRLAWAAALACACCTVAGVAAAQGVERALPGAVPLTPSVPASLPPGTAVVSTPNGLLRMAGTGTSATALAPLAAARSAVVAADAASAAVHAAFVNGVSMKVLDAPTSAVTPVTTPMRGAVDQVLPDGSRMRVLPAASTPIAALARARATSPERRIVDVDPDGRTADPADATRQDVLFRRVDRLTTR